MPLISALSKAIYGTKSECAFVPGIRIEVDTSTGSEEGG